jgi:hypothetical protein
MKKGVSQVSVTQLKKAHLSYLVNLLQLTQMSIQNLVLDKEVQGVTHWHFIKGKFQQELVKISKITSNLS